jgi:hypothetical protein
VERLSGTNRKVLSLVTLTQLLPAAVRAGYEPKPKLPGPDGSPTTCATLISATGIEQIK